MTRATASIVTAASNQSIDATENLARLIARRLRELLVSGRWSTGSRLPSTRQLATQYGVSKKTVGQAFEILERDGLIERQDRRRSVVRPPTPDSARNSARQVAVLMTPAVAALSRTEPNWMGQVLWAADETLLKHDYHPVRIPLPALENVGTTGLAATIDKLVAGLATAGVILIGGLPESKKVAPMLDERHVPWVSLRPLSSVTPYNYVTVDFFDACRVIGELFVRGGRRRVMYMGMTDNREQMQMLAGFDFGVISAGGEHADVIHLPTRTLEEPEAHRLMREYCERHEPPDAVLAASDFLALGVVRACRDLGIDVPGRVGVAGASGYSASAYTDPPLTVIRHPMREIGQRLGNMLMTCVTEGRQRVMGVHIPTGILVRESFPADIDTLNAINIEGNATPVTTST